MPNVHRPRQAHNSTGFLVHAWERGTNENTNGLVRQYLPKQQSMKHPTQHDCNAIARQLNNRPRKRLGYRTPEECYAR